MEKTRVERFGEVLGKYAYYYKDICDIVDLPILKPIKLKDLHISKGVLQRAYKEMALLSFDGNVIDYICSVAVNYLFYLGTLGTTAAEIDKHLKNDSKYDSPTTVPYIAAMKLLIRNENCLKDIIHEGLETNDDFIINDIIETLKEGIRTLIE